jgi:peptide deformylase
MDLDLKKVGDDCLRKTSERIETIDETIKDLISQMKIKMVEWNGCGLAAPQVGKNVRAIVVLLKTGEIQEMINPRISWTSQDRESMQEGCLSIPEMLANVDRPVKIRVKFQTLSGEHKYWSLHNFDARVVLHECDHLDGILMTDKEL